MTISVVCPGCKKRFTVHDKFAGKKGPCPKCKAVIQVPEKTEEVVVHTPEEFGPKGSSGQAVLKPIARRETRFSPLVTAAVVVGGLGVLIAAWLLRSTEGYLVLSLGAVLLGPPLAWGGYAFLRDDELEPYRGGEAALRVTICGLVYAAIWGAIAVLGGYVFRGAPFSVDQLAFIVPAMVGLGTFGAFASLELDISVGAMHYGLYLAVTVVLRLIMGLPAI